ncbi:MAG: hypothetical protein V1933_01785 [Candidatus Omnitrophota bacterium]
MPHKTISVLFSDDEKAFQNTFVAAHEASGFHIEHTDDIYSVPQKLRTARKLPDLVVLDLYRTEAQPGTKEADAANADIDRCLDKLKRVLGELKTLVDRTKTPAAIKVLREIRACPRLVDLPVLIYTRQGLSVLSDEDIRDAIHLGAEWMLKGRSPELEAAQMRAFLWNAQQRRKRLKRDVVLTILGAILGAAIGALF